MAHTEKDAVGGVKGIEHLVILEAICEIERVLDSICKCRESKEEGEDGQMPLWFFYEQSSYIGVGQEV